MGKILIPTSFNIDLEFDTAPFHTRMFAWIIDFVLQVFYIVLAFEVYGSVIKSTDGNVSEYDQWAMQLIILLPVFCYHFFCEWWWNGQSIGKKITGIRVVNDNGGKASVSQYMIRWLLRASDLSIPIVIIAIVFGLAGFLKAMGVTSLLFIIDLVLVAANKQSKRLGDLAAGTLVIKAHPKGDLADTVFMEIQDDYVPAFPQVMRLSDRDVNTIKEVLDNGRKTGQEQVAVNVSARIKQALAIESPITSFDFLETLLKDYNYLSAKG